MIDGAEKVDAVVCQLMGRRCGQGNMSRPGEISLEDARAVGIERGYLAPYSPLTSGDESEMLTARGENEGRTVTKRIRNKEPKRRRITLGRKRQT